MTPNNLVLLARRCHTKYSTLLLHIISLQQNRPSLYYTMEPNNYCLLQLREENIVSNMSVSWNENQMI